MVDWTGKRILICGDVMLDVDIFGTIDRQCPEAPVPCVLELRREYRPGGAANVAAAIERLGGLPTILGITGRDEESKLLWNSLGSIKREFFKEESPVNRPTTVKQRVYIDGKMQWRLDRESVEPISDTLAASLIWHAEDYLEESDAVVISDYDKGVCTPKVCREVIHLAREHGKPVVVDPKGGDWSKYIGCTVIKPSAAEYGATIFPCDTRFENMLVTCGSAGMLLFRRGAEAPIKFSAPTDPDFHAIGAGDRVAAALALALAAGADVETAARAAAETVADFHKLKEAA